MTPGQKKTVRVLAGALVFAFVLCAGLLGWEFYSLTLDDSATISEVIWVLWTEQPGPVALVLMTLSFWVGALLSHWMWQSKDVYDAVRRRDWGER